MLKKFGLTIFLFFLALGTVHSAPIQKITLFYDVPETILQVQNSEENATSGATEFEKTLTKNYSKRFVIKKIQRAPREFEASASYYNEKTSPDTIPFVIKISLEGQGESSTFYQNAFGASGVGTAPTVKVHLIEATTADDGINFYKYDYGVKDYGFGTFSVGRYIYTSEKDPRKNTKGAITGFITDVCTLNNSINKYANPEAYEQEQNRFSGNFKEAAIHFEKTNSDKTSRIEKFKAWCNSNETRKMYLSGLNALPNNQDFAIEYIKQMIAMGAYSE